MNSKDYKPLTDGNFAIETPSAFDSTECNRIIDSAKNFKQGGIQGKNGLEGSIKKDTSKVRKVKTFFDNQDWVYDRIWPIMEDMNQRAEWGFQIQSTQAYQISKYEVGDFYSSHIDSLGTQGTAHINKNFGAESLDGTTRKISMSLILNDDYEGGDLILYQIGKMKSVKGSLIFFPSFLPHEVSPVTKGTRYSLVMWFLGKPWV